MAEKPAVPEGKSATHETSSALANQSPWWKNPKVLLTLFTLLLVGAGLVYLLATMEDRPEESPSTIPSPTVSQTATPAAFVTNPLPTITFDGCGEPEAYRAQGWYGDFDSKVRTHPVVGTTRIQEVCYAADAGVVIFVTSGEGMGPNSPKVGKYLTATGEVVPVQRNTKGREVLIPAHGQFGPQNGTSVEYREELTSEGCPIRHVYRYDIPGNVLELVDYARGC